MTRNIDLPPLTRAADLLRASIDAAERTIDVVWSTGARVRRNPFFGDPFDEELAMDPRAVRLDRLNAGAPLLRVYDASVLDSIIGSVVPGSARVENGRGIARVRFSDRTEVEPLWKDVEAGAYPCGLDRLPGPSLRGDQAGGRARVVARGRLDALRDFRSAHRR
ncbi:hypothetical protein [Rhodopseudomonas palustris]|uniref:hypothetical protein n=1 Tax=Rhodopseudomonas palustris TaxID=1076 RepID=UPI00005D78D9